VSKAEFSVIGTIREFLRSELLFPSTCRKLGLLATINLGISGDGFASFSDSLVAAASIFYFLPDVFATAGLVDKGAGWMGLGLEVEFILGILPVDLMDFLS
jgi:hypothetical protein